MVEMVGTVRSDGSMSVTPVMDSISTNDSVLKMAELVTQINEESAQIDHPDLPVREDSPEGEIHDSFPSRKEKKRDGRVVELTTKVAEAARERDAFEKRARELELHNKELELQLLAQKKEELDRDLSGIGSALIDAQASRDAEKYIETNKLFSQYALRQSQAEQELESRQNEMLSLQAQEQAQKTDKDVPYETLHQLSHPKELESTYYHDWLKENQAYNPYSDEYMPSLAQEVAAMKEEYNAYLYVHKKQKEIGSPEYYDALDELITNVHQQRYGDLDSLYRHQRNNQQQETPDMRKSLGNASVAPVIRGGNEYDASMKLPPLTDLEKQFAEKCDMYEGQGAQGSKYGRPLQPYEKHRLYQENKAKLFGGR